MTFKVYFVDGSVHLCSKWHFFRCEWILQLTGRVRGEQEVICDLWVYQDAMWDQSRDWSNLNDLNNLTFNSDIYACLKSRYIGKALQSYLDQNDVKSFIYWIVRCNNELITSNDCKWTLWKNRVTSCIAVWRIAMTSSDCVFNPKGLCVIKNR